MSKCEARPPNSGKPLKPKNTKVRAKARAGRGESPQGYGENFLGSEPKGEEWAILTQAALVPFAATVRKEQRLDGGRFIWPNGL